jgi:hypothetical protein
MTKLEKGVIAFLVLATVYFVWQFVTYAVGIEFNGPF